MPTYALIGAAGYIAPRHLQAIAETGGELVAAHDPHDAVGHLDRYFPEAAFFTEMERFDRHLEKRKRAGRPTDYLSICSPNYLHDAHIRFGLRSGMNVICEKPLVLHTRNAEALLETEQATGRRVNTILQLRLHPALQALKTRVAQSHHRHQVELTYITPRGSWYHSSWKGDPQKSGGIATNIGIHFFDLLCWVFGEVQQVEVHQASFDRASGYLLFEKAEVRWFLSISARTLPPQAQGTTYRHLDIDGQSIEFSEGFTDLHRQSYQQILAGQGFGIQDLLPATRLAEYLRNAPLESGDPDHRHPMAQLPQELHPFLRDGT